MHKLSTGIRFIKPYHQPAQDTMPDSPPPPPHPNEFCNAGDGRKYLAKKPLPPPPHF